MNEDARPFIDDWAETLVSAARSFVFSWGDVYWRDDVDRWEIRHGHEIDGETVCVCGAPREPMWFGTWDEVLPVIANHEREGNTLS